MTALFFRFDQAKGMQVKQVILNKSNLILRHAATLQVNGDAGQVRRSSLALGRCSVAIPSAEFFLNLDCPYRGVQLDLLVEPVVINLRYIFDKVARPHARVAARRIETRLDAKRFARLNGNKFARGLQLFKLGVVEDTRQLQAIDFFILSEQGIMRGPEERIPQHAADSAKRVMLMVWLDAMKSKGVAAHAEE